MTNSSRRSPGRCHTLYDIVTRFRPGAAAPRAGAGGGRRGQQLNGFRLVSGAKADRLACSPMKLGLGLYRHMLTRENFQFARQAGATHLVVHLVDYFKGGAHNPRDNQPTGTDRGWGLAGDPHQLWSQEELLDLCRAAQAEGLKIEAIENFDPA